MRLNAVFLLVPPAPSSKQIKRPPIPNRQAPKRKSLLNKTPHVVKRKTIEEPPPPGMGFKIGDIHPKELEKEKKIPKTP